MKRHDSLAPLSREHHGALLLAQLLKKDTPAYKGLPTLLSDKAAYALNMFHSNLFQHFKQEEAMLEKIKNVHTDIDQLSEEILAEHVKLTAGFLALDKSGINTEELDILGHALDEHIRKEERVLFPMIQEYCTEEELNNLNLNGL